MMFCPTGHCLCRTVQSESIRIWNDLQDADKLNSPIHEDTVTQIFALTLNRQHSSQNRVHIFGRKEENKNGSDFLWILFSADLSRNFRLAVQAKRLYQDGKYKVFTNSQVCNIITYAKLIGAVPVYVFYNYWPFRSQYYASINHRLYFGPHGLGFDHARDFGAIYVHAEDMQKLSARDLSPKHIVGRFLPLWYPFCYCELSKAPTPLGELAGRFTNWIDSEDGGPPKCQETEQSLKLWMEGRSIEDELLDKMLLLRADQASEAFVPSFILGTRLASGNSD